MPQKLRLPIVLDIQHLQERAIKKLKALGGGFTLIRIGGATYARSVPGELNMDKNQVLGVAQVRLRMQQLVSAPPAAQPSMQCLCQHSRQQRLHMQGVQGFTLSHDPCSVFTSLAISNIRLSHHWLQLRSLSIGAL